MTLCLLLNFFLLRGRAGTNKTARPDAVSGGGGPGYRAGPVSQPPMGRTPPQRRPRPAMLGRTATLTSRCSDIHLSRAEQQLTHVVNRTSL